MSGVTTRKTVLSNGLTVLGEVNPAHKSAALGYFVRTGSRDETPLESGISHFLEHMMFKGTQRRSALDITFELGNIGAQANAFTSEENTVYYAAVLPEFVSDLHDLLSDMLAPALVQEEFDTEKKVILEEIALYQDRPQFYLFEQATTEFFAGHPAGNSVLGTTASVSAITSTQMREYFQRRYTPPNMVLVGSGNFDWSAFVGAAEALTADWKVCEAPRSNPPFVPPVLRRDLSRKNLNQGHVLLLGPGCSAKDEARYALSVLGVIVGDGSGSKFYWELVESGLAETASADNEERDGCGCFVAYASAEPDRLDLVASTMRKILESARNFTEDELARAKTKIVTRIALGAELPMGRLMSLGLEWNYRGAIHSVRDEIARFQSVTARDIEVALERFDIAKLSEFRLVPE